jgi:hypothetical protein
MRSRDTHLLNDIGTELLHRESAHVAKELTNDSITEAAVIQVQDVLHHIVAIWILYKRERIVRYLVYELNALMIRGVVNASLKHTAPMSVRSHFNTICCNRVINELKKVISLSQEHYEINYLVVFRRKFIETFLDDVVAIKVFDQDDHM